jgi:uncharacterized Zn-binding protein involved in type VI secretion
MGLTVARLGDTSDHGGAIVTAGTMHDAGGIEIARVTDILACPIHGPNPIVTGSPNFVSQGQKVARTSSLTACGAAIIGSAPNYVCD